MNVNQYRAMSDVSRNPGVLAEAVQDGPVALTRYSEMVMVCVSVADWNKREREMAALRAQVEEMEG